VKARKLISRIFLILTLAVVLIVLVGGCAKSLPGITGATKMTVKGEGSYAAFSVKELAVKAKIIVRGKVISQGQSFEFKIGKGEAVLLATPITIQVTEWIKGDPRSDTVIFNKMGGETATRIMAPITAPLKEADDVILCLSADGYSLGPDSLFKIQKDGSVVVENFQLPEHEGFKNGKRTSVIQADELISELKKELKQASD
jgi:hypothetical protein